MAVKVLQSSVVANYEVTASNTFHAGWGLILDTTNSNFTVRGPSTDEVTVWNFAGVALGDHLTTGNTFIQNDPVGSSVVSADGLTFTSYANGFFVGTKRAIGDYQDETAAVVTNLTDTSPTPHRGIGCLRAPGSQFVTDMYVTSGTYTPGAFCYVGDTDSATADEGKATSANSGGDKLYRADYLDSTAGLLYLTITM